MKHLRRFNESVNKEEELQDFCETYLAYLLDDGFEVSVETSYDHWKNNSEYLGITIKKTDNGFFKWNDIKDQFIPFISVLSKEYKLNGRCISFNGIRYYTFHDPYTQLGMDDLKHGSETVRKIYTPKNIIAERIDFKNELRSITIFIK